MRTSSILIACIGSAFLLLVTMVFLPGGSDIYIFSIGGKMLNAGLTPYKDFIDSKPPGIFAVYCFIHTLLGESILAIRAFDVIYHLFTLGLFFVLIRRYFGSTTIAALTLPIYALWYVSMGIWDTAQSESFAVLPSLVIIAAIQYSLDKSRGIYSPALLGIICGLAAVAILSLKFTLIYVLICSLLVLWMKGTSVKHNSILTIFSLLVVLLSVVLFYDWLHVYGAYENFTLMMEWLSFYSNNHPFSDHRTFSTVFYTRFPQTLLAIFSPTYVMIAMIGIAISLSSKAQRTSIPEINRSFILQLLLLLSAGLMTILFERKNIRYHFIRGFWPLAPFIALGLYYVYQQGLLKLKRSSADALKKFAQRGLLLTGVVILLLLSPILKFSTETGGYVLHAVTGYETTSYLDYRKIGEEQQLDSLELFLRSNLKENENFFFWGTIIGPYTKLNIFPPTIMMMNLQLSSPWTPVALRTKVLQQLYETKPRYFIIQKGDYMPDLSATIYDSYGLLFLWYELFEFLDLHYEERIVMDSFIIYEYSHEKESQIVF